MGAPAAAERLGRLIWVLVAALGAYTALRFELRSRSIVSADSWFAMSRALQYMHDADPGQVYKALLFAHHIKFQYAPTGLLLLEVLHRLGVDQVSELNFFNAWLMAATGLVIAVLATRLLPRLVVRGIPVPIGPLAFLFALRFFPSSFAFEIGQIQVLLGLLFSLACLAILQGRPGLAGFLMALAATIKPQFLAFGVLALWRREWRFLAGFAVVSAMAVVAALWLYGWEAQFSYFRDVLPYLSRHGECSHINQSVNGLLNRYLEAAPCVDHDPQGDPGAPAQSWFPPYNGAVYAGTLLSSLMLLAVPFLVKPQSSDRSVVLLHFCVACLAFTMASPIAWIHHYNIMVPCYLAVLHVFASGWRGRSDTWLLAALAASWLLSAFAVSQPFAPTGHHANLLQSHTFFGACLLIVVAVVLLRRPLPESASRTAWKFAWTQ
jgi:hypothetical protein